MAVSKKHQWSDRRYVASDKHGQFLPKVRCICGYHTLTHTNYLEAQVWKMKDSYMNRVMCCSKSARKLVKPSLQLSCGDHGGCSFKLSADNHEYIGYLHGESDQNPSSTCHRMLSEHCTIIDVFWTPTFWLRVNSRVFRAESCSSNDGHEPHWYIGRRVVSSSVQKITYPTIPGGR